MLFNFASIPQFLSVMIGMGHWTREFCVAERPLWELFSLIAPGPLWIIDGQCLISTGAKIILSANYLQILYGIIHVNLFYCLIYIIDRWEIFFMIPISNHILSDFSSWSGYHGVHRPACWTHYTDGYHGGPDGTTPAPCSPCSLRRPAVWWGAWSRGVCSGAAREPESGCWGRSELPKEAKAAPIGVWLLRVSPKQKHKNMVYLCAHYTYAGYETIWLDACSKIYYFNVFLLMVWKSWYMHWHNEGMCEIVQCEFQEQSNPCSIPIILGIYQILRSFTSPTN